jgi:hypothetical protein
MMKKVNKFQSNLKKGKHKNENKTIKSKREKRREFVKK